jgi:Fe2+ or Zn2+ uptake regulation protein
MGFMEMIKGKLPCKFAHHYWETIGEKWMGSCPMFECIYEGELIIAEDCEENESCPAYEPVETLVCKKHDIEYYEICSKCEDEMMGGER